MTPAFWVDNYHRKLHTCKCGAGQEQTHQKADTQGFPLQDEPAVRYDHRRSQKLYMRRNNRRLNQTSLDMIQSWRGNCDIQILIYDSDPDFPCAAEIARVTDYVVGYACKGNVTLNQERAQNIQLVKA